MLTHVSCFRRWSWSRLDRHRLLGRAYWLDRSYEDCEVKVSMVWMAERHGQVVELPGSVLGRAGAWSSV